MKGVFHDQSGVRLRSWMGVDDSIFYESGLIAVLPMDFYFPDMENKAIYPLGQSSTKNGIRNFLKQCLILN
ncbi:hypothetical protein MGH68_18145 [Erysipelothrix sp. D19-032]